MYLNQIPLAGIVQGEDFKKKCQDDSAMNHPLYPDRAAIMCNKAASFCCETADHAKIVTNQLRGFNETIGLYNECKCDFWYRLCEDARGGEACDYAAEYCCGDYKYRDETFYYLNSPVCYCDFFNYAKNELGHTLTPKALNINKEFSNPCGHFENIFVWEPFGGINGDYEEEMIKNEKESLIAIFNATNGENWTKSDGWMNETVDHCQWYVANIMHQCLNIHFSPIHFSACQVDLCRY
jgi:hypothetical protein